MDEISSRADLKEWLENKPQDWGRLLAHRMVLRVVPVLNQSIGSPNLKIDLKSQLTLSVLRIPLSSEVAVYTSNPEIRDALRDIATAALNFHDVSAAGRVVYTAYVAYSIPGIMNASDVARVESAADTVYTLHTKGVARIGSAALNHDVQWLEVNGLEEKHRQKFLGLPLWHGQSNPLETNWQDLKYALQAMDPNWQFWTDWYQAKLDGTLHPGLTQSQQENLYYQIATYPNELWELGAEVVNQRITQLMEEIKKYEGIFEDTKEYDFFLSYSTKDEHLAALIADIILQKGYSVFAQFNDMPVGSNFITEMQEGLENSSRFICLYSEDYWASDYCQQEWNAAITYDPRGKERKIVPFLISEYAIPPLARPLVYKNLIGLNNEEFQKAVLEAIENDSVITSEQARMVAKDTISPEPYFNDDQELDIRANEDYDQHRVTEDLYNLPDEQITLIDNLLDRIKDRNIVPQAIVFGFEQYRDQLVKGGVQPNISLLNNLFKLIELDIETSETDEWKSKQTDFLFEQIGENHTKFQTHFPLDMVREENYRDAPMEVDKFNEDSFYKQIQSLNKIFKELKQEQMATDRFLENRQYEYEQIQQLLNLDATRIIKTDENAVIQSEKEMNFDDYKKRRLIQVASFADKLSDVLDKSDKVIKSPTTKFLSKMAKDLADWLWK